MRNQRCFVAAPLALLIAAAGAAAGDPIVATDLLRLRNVTSIDVARDGSRAVFAVRSIGEIPGEGDIPAYANQSHLYLLDLSDERAEPRQLTWGNRADGDPVLSPDGRRIAFVRTAPEGGKPQVWVMPIDGGESRPMTDLPHGAAAPRWSPDGRQLLVTAKVPADDLPGAPDWPSERPSRQWKDAAGGEDITPRPDGTRAEIRAWLAANAQRLDPNVITRLKFKDERALAGLPRFKHLFIVDPDDEAAEPVRITSAFADHDDAVFMPDGSGIIYSTKTAGAEHPDRVDDRSLRLITADGATDRLVLGLAGWSMRRPRPSRDGMVIAFAAHPTERMFLHQTRLGVASITDEGASEPMWLTGPDMFDAQVRSFRWMPTRSALLFTTVRQGGFPLMTMGLGLLEPATLVDEQDGMPAGVNTFAVGGGAIVYSLTTPTAPCTIRVRDGRGDRLAADLNHWVADKELSIPQEGWITRPDGTAVQYWLMEPTRRLPTQRYPLAVQIHGGPGGMWGPGGFSTWLEFQLLCSWGYAVAYGNPRGSAGYGEAFLAANFQDWGTGPAGDVLAVVDQVLINDWIDPERLVVTGGSYGGYLTAYIVTQDHRFKAAVAQRGLYDFATFAGEGNAWHLLESYMAGYPWEARLRTVFQRDNPLSFVTRIRTPLLIIHGDKDLRVGVSQSEMLYRALKKLGRPVEYARYPDADHGLSRRGDPLQRLDRLNRLIEFFERFIDNPRPAPRVERAAAPAQ